MHSMHGHGRCSWNLASQQVRGYSAGDAEPCTHSCDTTHIYTRVCLSSKMCAPRLVLRLSIKLYMKDLS